ncbi:hypothetical protein BAG01nite_49560 [Brevibacillus agri]|uniref:Uncharacterized protein n=1 Tax=Brevibacillus agri TaxID=51101 RepID=A0ABQ0SY00_9BACL|nr:hypothetical protein BAG01nite_49560 [Brevibacillus agri]
MNSLGRLTKERDSRVIQTSIPPRPTPSSAGHVKSRVNLAGPSAKAKYYLATDSEPVP